MYANVVEVEVDPSADPERKALYEMVIPRVRQLPGVVSGQWMEPIDGKGLSVVNFDTEDAARGALEAMGLKVGSSPGPGVTVLSVQTREVIGNL
jgi:hypothetical protein